jgi:hypothetical protein
METIIQQIVADLSKEILEYLTGGGMRNIGKASKEILKLLTTAVHQILKVAIAEMDQALQNDKAQRKSDGWRIKEKGVSRQYLLSTGILEYERTYFENVNTKERRCLVDYLIGVEESARMSREIEAELINNASDMSYARSSASVCDGILSRQTVRNKILDVSQLAYLPDKKEKTPKELHIFADEDHVHMQSSHKSGNKKHGEIVRLITTSEGLHRVSKGKNELICPIHFEGYKIKPEKQWEYVLAVLTETYNMDEIENIWIHGDGGLWIKTGLSILPKAKPVIDMYHLNKSMKILKSGPGNGAAPSLWWALKHNKRDEFIKFIGKVVDKIPEYYKDERAQAKAHERISKTGSYILNNWSSIQNRLNVVKVGSCTEPLISHVLSERLSRNPMGWSKSGLSKMAMIIVYTKNGCVISVDDVRGGERKVITSIKKYESLINNQLEAMTREVHNWEWLKGESYSLGKTTGTSVLLRSYGRINDVC